MMVYSAYLEKNEKMKVSKKFASAKKWFIQLKVDGLFINHTFSGSFDELQDEIEKMILTHSLDKTILDVYITVI